MYTIIRHQHVSTSLFSCKWWSCYYIHVLVTVGSYQRFVLKWSLCRFVIQDAGVNSFTPHVRCWNPNIPKFISCVLILLFISPFVLSIWNLIFQQPLYCIGYVIVPFVGLYSSLELLTFRRVQLNSVNLRYFQSPDNARRQSYEW